MFIVKENIYNNIFYKLGLSQFKGTSVYRIEAKRGDFGTKKA